ncbi:MAG: HlyD family secretion protein [Symbiobacteriia bacterium]
MRSVHVASAATALILAMGVGLVGCSPSTSGKNLTTSGTITATEVQVAAEVVGKVSSVAVDEGQRVKQGDAVATLDAGTLDIQVRQARAALQSVQSKLAEAKAGPRAAQVQQVDAALRQAQAALDGAQKGYDAVRQAFDKKAATQAQLDAAETQLKIVQAQADGAQAQANLVKQGASAEQLKQLQAAVDQAQAGLDMAQLNRQRAAVKAPIGGVVVRRLVEPGAMVAPGAPIAVLANLDDLWLRVYVPEDQLSQAQLGTQVQVRVDSYPGRTFRAEVSYISDTAEFTPRNVQTKEERATTVYAVKLRLLDGLGGELKPGMPADVVFATPGGAK